MSDEDRRRILAQAIQSHVAVGWTLQHQSDYTATLLGGRAVNHVMHGILTFFLTCGLWSIVWLILAMSSRKLTLSIWVDEYGIVGKRQGY